MADGLTEIIAGLERQRVAIERALEALRGIDGPVAAAPAPVSRPATAKAVAKKASRRGRISPEGRKRLAEAMKRRWAVKRAGATVRKAAAKATKKKAA